MLMGAADRGVDAQVPRDRAFRIGQGLEPGEDPVPGAVPLPSAEQVVDPAPRPLRDGHVPPRNAGPPETVCRRSTADEARPAAALPWHPSAYGTTLTGPIEMTSNHVSERKRRRHRDRNMPHHRSLGSRGHHSGHHLRRLPPRPQAASVTRLTARRQRHLCRYSPSPGGGGSGISQMRLNTSATWGQTS